MRSKSTKWRVRKRREDTLNVSQHSAMKLNILIIEANTKLLMILNFCWQAQDISALLFSDFFIILIFKIIITNFTNEALK